MRSKIRKILREKIFKGSINDKNNIVKNLVQDILKEEDNDSSELDKFLDIIAKVGLENLEYEHLKDAPKELLDQFINKVIEKEITIDPQILGLLSQENQETVDKYLTEKIKRGESISFDAIRKASQEVVDEYIKKNREKGIRTPNSILKLGSGDVSNELEENLEEDYPSSFNMEEFRSLDTFKDRIRYAKEKLSKIASGTGRMVFKIDDEKVLKLAKNKKGIAQNEAEITYYNDPFIRDIFAKIYEYDKENYRWVEMQLVKKMKKSDFKRLIGIDFDDYARYIENEHFKANSGDPLYYMDKGTEENLKESEFVYDMVDFIVNFDVPAGDLTRPSSYGIVEENGDERIVLIDYGLSKDVEQEFYK